MSRRIVSWWVWILVLVVGGGVFYSLVIARQSGEEDPIAVRDASMFDVPAGPTDDLLTFIERLANPTHRFTSEAELQWYMEHSADSISLAADRILDGNATDEQTATAIEWKVEALRIQSRLGDRTAAGRSEDFLNEHLDDPRQKVADAAMRMKLARRLERWRVLSPAERQETVDEVVAHAQDRGISYLQARMVMRLGDRVADSPDRELGIAALDGVLPVVRTSDDPKLQQFLPELEGMARRLNLPGNRLELEGPLLEGGELDWESYEGKVVLVDFWASWCDVCRQEVPNIMENYKKYRDQGFEVVGVCGDEDREKAEAYVRQAGIPWPSIYHENESRDEEYYPPMFQRYAITGLPRLILIDRDGKVIEMQAYGSILDRHLERLFGEEGKTAAPEVDMTGSMPAPQAVPEVF